MKYRTGIDNPKCLYENHGNHFEFLAECPNEDAAARIRDILNASTTIADAWQRHDLTLLTVGLDTLTAAVNGETRVLQMSMEGE